MPARTAIIIPGYNGGPLLLECLARATATGCPVIVVDNDSRDNSITAVRREFPGVCVLANERNLGFAAAGNRGATGRTEEFLLFLNQDALLLPGAVPAAERFFDCRPRVGAATGLVRNPDGTRQLNLRRFPTYSNVFFGRRSPLTRLLPGNPWSRRFLLLDADPEAEQVVDAVSGMCMFVRRAAFEAVGGFDSGYFFFVEDADLCYRLKTAGWDAAYFPCPVAVHFMGERLARDRRRVNLAHLQGFYRFYRKHYHPGPLRIALLETGLFLRRMVVLALGR